MGHVGYADDLGFFPSKGVICNWAIFGLIQTSGFLPVLHICKKKMVFLNTGR